VVDATDCFFFFFLGEKKKHLFNAFYNIVQLQTLS
jgi:hypothetical protein